MTPDNWTTVMDKADVLSVMSGRLFALRGADVSKQIKNLNEFTPYETRMTIVGEDAINKFALKIEAKSREGSYQKKDKSTNEWDGIYSDEHGFTRGTAVVPFEDNMVSEPRKDPEADDLGQFVDVTMPEALVPTTPMLSKYNDIRLEHDRIYHGVILAFITQRINLGTLLTLYETVNIAPVNMIIAGPTDRYLMAGAVIMKGGQDTGITKFTMFSWAAGKNADLGLTHFSSKWYSTAAVTNRDGVYLFTAAYYKTYLGGGGVVMFEDSDHTAWRDNHFLAVSDEVGRASIIPIMVPLTEKLLTSAMDMRGYFTGSTDTSKRQRHYSTAPYYCARYGWDEMPHMPYGMGEKVVDHDVRANSTILQGYQCNFKQTGDNSGDWVSIIENTGHHGKFEPGQHTALVRNGAEVTVHSQITIGGSRGA